MQYRYAEKRNYEGLASGRVFYSSAGQPAFPVRLASEIFQRTIRHLHAAGKNNLCTIYDPVCGGAYWLAVLAYLHWDLIGAIYASDIQPEVLTLAERNLSLITQKGLIQRISEIETMLVSYQKESHARALENAIKLKTQLETNLKTHTIQTKLFTADATNFQSISIELKEQQIDMVIADIPYGWHSEWQTEKTESRMTKNGISRQSTPLWQMLDALNSCMKPGIIIAIASDKSQKVEHANYRRLERFQVGKRRVFILQSQ